MTLALEEGPVEKSAFALVREVDREVREVRDDALPDPSKRAVIAGAPPIAEGAERSTTTTTTTDPPRFLERAKGSAGEVRGRDSIARELDDLPSATAPPRLPSGPAIARQRSGFPKDGRANPWNRPLPRLPRRPSSVDRTSLSDFQFPRFNFPA